MESASCSFASAFASADRRAASAASTAGCSVSRVICSATARAACSTSVRKRRFFLVDTGQRHAHELLGHGARRRLGHGLRRGFGGDPGAVGDIGACRLQDLPRRVLHRRLGRVHRLAGDALGRRVNGRERLAQLVVGGHRFRPPRGFRRVDGRLHGLARGLRRGGDGRKPRALVFLRRLGAPRGQRLAGRVLRRLLRHVARGPLGRGRKGGHRFAHEPFGHFVGDALGDPGSVRGHGRRGNGRGGGRYGASDVNRRGGHAERHVGGRSRSGDGARSRDANRGRCTLLELRQHRIERGVVDRLGHERAGAVLARPLAVLRRVVAGAHDHRNRRRLGVGRDDARDLVAVHVRHHEVHEDHVRRVALEKIERLVARTRRVHAQAAGFEHALQLELHHLGIVDDQRFADVHRAPLLPQTKNSNVPRTAAGMQKACRMPLASARRRLRQAATPPARPPLIMLASGTRRHRHIDRVLRHNQTTRHQRGHT